MPLKTDKTCFALFFKELALFPVRAATIQLPHDMIGMMIYA